MPAPSLLPLRYATGMFKWIAKYVAEEQVALEKLLFVFGIMVVRSLDPL